MDANIKLQPILARHCKRSCEVFSVNTGSASKHPRRLQGEDVGVANVTGFTYFCHGTEMAPTDRRWTEWHDNITGREKRNFKIKKGGEGEEENNRLVRKMLGKKRNGEKTRVIDSSLVYCDLNSGLACRWLRTRSVDFYGDNDVWRHSVTFLSLISWRVSERHKERDVSFSGERCWDKGLSAS